MRWLLDFENGKFWLVDWRLELCLGKPQDSKYLKWIFLFLLLVVAKVIGLAQWKYDAVLILTSVRDQSKTRNPLIMLLPKIQNFWNIIGYDEIYSDEFLLNTQVRRAI